MSALFDQDAPETQLGFREAQQNAELLYEEVMHQYDLENTPYFTEDGEERYHYSDVVGAEARHDEHLIQNRALLENVDQWKPHYESIDHRQAEAQAKAQELHAAMVHEIEAPGGSGDIAGAEERLHGHLDEHRLLLGNQEQWRPDYEAMDAEQILKPKERDTGLGL